MPHEPSPMSHIEFQQRPSTTGHIDILHDPEQSLHERKNKQSYGLGDVPYGPMVSDNSSGLIFFLKLGLFRGNPPYAMAPAGEALEHP